MVNETDIIPSVLASHRNLTEIIPEFTGHFCKTNGMDTDFKELVQIADEIREKSMNGVSIMHAIFITQIVLRELYRDLDAVVQKGGNIKPKYETYEGMFG